MTHDNDDIIELPQYLANININGYIISASERIKINPNINGVNGLDEGSLAPLTVYAYFVIADSREIKPVAGIMCMAKKDYPLLPEGYDFYRIEGFIFTDERCRWQNEFMYKLTH